MGAAVGAGGPCSSSTEFVADGGATGTAAEGRAAAVGGGAEATASGSEVSRKCSDNLRTLPDADGIADASSPAGGSRTADCATAGLISGLVDTWVSVAVRESAAAGWAESVALEWADSVWSESPGLHLPRATIRPTAPSPRTRRTAPAPMAHFRAETSGGAERTRSVTEPATVSAPALVTIRWERPAGVHTQGRPAEGARASPRAVTVASR
jgi:hypothetical protein